MFHRLNITLPPSYHIIHTSNNQHTAKHDNTPVHIRHIRRIDHREETRNTSHCYVEYCEDVDWDAEFAEGEAGGWEGLVAEAGLEDAAGVRVSGSMGG